MNMLFYMFRFFNDSMILSKEVVLYVKKHKKELDLYWPILYFKNIKRIEEGISLTKFKENAFLTKLELKYSKYIINKDKMNTENVNFIDIDNPFDYSFYNDYLNLIDKKDDKIKYLKLDQNNNSVLLNHFNNLELKKMSYRLRIPYYFFPQRYNERSMPTQLKYWTSSVYNYDKENKRGNNFLDIYVSHLIESFFNIKLLNRRNVWNEIFYLKGFKFKVYNIIRRYVGFLINYTKTNPSFRLVPSSFLRSIWFKKQMRFLSWLKSIRNINKWESSFFPKRRYYLRRLSKILISKPLFKHTSNSLIIDLFLYNSKTHKKEKLKNMLFRRSMYRYMSSMYADYYKKIRETLNRPRFFYLSLIEPQISSYYQIIIDSYEKLLMKKNEILLFGLYLLLLSLNYFKISEESKLELSFVKLKKYVYNKDKNRVIVHKNENEIRQKKIKKISKTQSRYLIMKKYFQELSRKSNTPINLNLLTLWDREGLGPEKNEKNKRSRVRRYGRKKVSYADYRKNHMWVDNNNKRKGKVSTKELKKRLMGFFLFSRSQKHNTKPVKKYIRKVVKNVSQNDNYKEIYSINNLNNNILFNNNNRVVKENNNIENNNNLRPDFMSINSSEKIISVNNNERKKENYILKIMKNSLLFGSFYLYQLDNNIKDVNSFSHIYMLRTRSLINNLKQYGIINQIDKKDKVLKWRNNYKNNNNMRSKYLWDHLDSSIIKAVLNKQFLSLDNESNNLNMLKNYRLNQVLIKLKNFSYFGDTFYLMYSLTYIKDEFYKVNRDVLLSEIRYMMSDDMEDNYVIKNGQYPFATDNREANLVNKLGYSEEIFKPYYRYMIPLLIIKTYYRFLSSLGYKKSFFSLNKYLRSKGNIMSNNTYILLNFITVKILFELFYHSYRSLIRVKPKLFYLNKIRFYLSKFKRLTFITWFDSIKKIRKFKKIPYYFSYRYASVVNYFYEQIRKNAELDTKRKVLVPYVLYFEDLLYTVYGKWVIFGLWPLKKYILSSFILTKRILLLIHWRNYYKNNNLMYRRIMTRLSNGIKLASLQKGYNYYLSHSKRWPNKLINNFENLNKGKGLTYSNLEYYYEKEDREHMLNSYVFSTRNLNFISSMYDLNNKFFVIKDIDTYFKENVYNIFPDLLMRNLEFKYESPMLRSLKNTNRFKRFYSDYVKNNIIKTNSLYLILKRNTDISGIKFRLAGRTHFTRSNERSFYKSSVYGNLMAPRHSSIKLLKPITPFIPVFRGCSKANIDYNLSISNSNNGSFSIKVWIASIMSADLYELLLYLVRIKELYNILLTKYWSHSQILRNQIEVYEWKDNEIYK